VRRCSQQIGFKAYREWRGEDLGVLCRLHFVNAALNGS